MRVYLESYGCAQNQGEGSALARSLEAAGHAVVERPDGADAGVLVTCAVIGATEDRMVRRWRELTRRCPQVVVTGCLVPLRAHLLDGPGRERTTLLPIRDQHLLPRLLTTPKSHTPAAPAAPFATEATAATPSTVWEELVIAQGCTSHCTYCYSRLARGRLTSLPMTEVLRRASDALSRGARELRLTSLDTSAWGIDREPATRLPALVREICRLTGDFHLRVGMMSPQTLRAIAHDYYESLDSPNAYRFLHLPVQSGSDEVLSRMRRGYTVAEVRSLVRAARERLPDLQLSTDIIVGYPGESEDDYQASLELVDALGAETVNVTRFSPRPGTPASRERAVAGSVAKRRSREFAARRATLGRTLRERWIGWEGPARIVEYGPRGTAVGRLPNYLPVVLPERPQLGGTVEVRVEGSRSTYLLGRTRGTESSTGPVVAAPPSSTSR